MQLSSLHVYVCVYMFLCMSVHMCLYACVFVATPVHKKARVYVVKYTLSSSNTFFFFFFATSFTEPGVVDTMQEELQWIRVLPAHPLAWL